MGAMGITTSLPRGGGERGGGAFSRVPGRGPLAPRGSGGDERDEDEGAGSREWEWRVSGLGSRRVAGALALASRGCFGGKCFAENDQRARTPSPCQSRPTQPRDHRGPPSAWCCSHSPSTAPPAAGWGPVRWDTSGSQSAGRTHWPCGHLRHSASRENPLTLWALGQQGEPIDPVGTRPAGRTR
jgi:hypothetical protein